MTDVLSKAHASLIGESLFSGTLTDKQWNYLDQMQREMQAEYRMRRQMLIKRLDVTVQSFQVIATNLRNLLCYFLWILGFFMLESLL